MSDSVVSGTHVVLEHLDSSSKSGFCDPVSIKLEDITAVKEFLENNDGYRVVQLQLRYQARKYDITSNNFARVRLTVKTAGSSSSSAEEIKSDFSFNLKYTSAPFPFGYNRVIGKRFCKVDSTSERFSKLPELSYQFEAYPVDQKSQGALLLDYYLTPLSSDSEAGDESTDPEIGALSLSF